jgi:hypothetical protein
MKIKKGSALVDPDVLSVAYPNTIVANNVCEFIEWDIEVRKRERERELKYCNTLVSSPSKTREHAFIC